MIAAIVRWPWGSACRKVVDPSSESSSVKMISQMGHDSSGSKHTRNELDIVVIKQLIWVKCFVELIRNPPYKVWYSRYNIVVK